MTIVLKTLTALLKNTVTSSQANANEIARRKPNAQHRSGVPCEGAAKNPTSLANPTPKNAAFQVKFTGSIAVISKKALLPIAEMPDVPEKPAIAPPPLVETVIAKQAKTANLVRMTALVPVEISATLQVANALPKPPVAMGNAKATSKKLVRVVRQIAHVLKANSATKTRLAVSPHHTNVATATATPKKVKPVAAALQIAHAPKANNATTTNAKSSIVVETGNAKSENKKIAKTAPQTANVQATKLAIATQLASFPNDVAMAIAISTKMKLAPIALAIANAPKINNATPQEIAKSTVGMVDAKPIVMKIAKPAPTIANAHPINFVTKVKVNVRVASVPRTNAAAIAMPLNNAKPTAQAGSNSKRAAIPNNVPTALAKRPVETDAVRPTKAKTARPVNEIANAPKANAATTIVVSLACAPPARLVVRVPPSYKPVVQTAQVGSPKKLAPTPMALSVTQFEKLVFVAPKNLVQALQHIDAKGLNVSFAHRDKVANFGREALFNVKPTKFVARVVVVPVHQANDVVVETNWKLAVRIAWGGES